MDDSSAIWAENPPDFAEVRLDIVWADVHEDVIGPHEIDARVRNASELFTLVDDESYVGTLLEEEATVLDTTWAEVDKDQVATERSDLLRPAAVARADLQNCG